MSGNIYFTRQESAERLYNALKPFKSDQIQYDKTYPVQFEAGTYYVRGDELSELQSKLIYLDGLDTATDGYLNKFYDRAASVLFNGRWMNSQAIALKYESFTPRNTRLYEETTKIIQGFVGSGRLYVSARDKNPIQQFNSEDLQTLTTLAMEFKLDAPILKAIEEETKGKENTDFVISNAGIASGAASGFKDIKDVHMDSAHHMLFSLGASSLKGLQFTKNIQERLVGIHGTIRHERGHRLMIWVSEDLYKKEGRDSFLNMVATLTGNENLYQRIDAVSAQFPSTRRSDLHQWAYFSQEVCDPVHFKKFSPQYFKMISRVHQQALEDLIRDLERYGSTYLDHWIDSSRFYMWFSFAQNITTYRGFQLDPTKIDKLDKTLSQLAMKAGPEQFEMYNLFKQWLKASQNTCALPEVQNNISKRMPTFYAPIKIQATGR